MFHCSFYPIFKSCEYLVESSNIVVNGNKINGSISNFHKLIYAFSSTKSEKIACRIIADSVMMAEKSMPIAGLGVSALLVDELKVIEEDAVRISHKQALETAEIICGNILVKDIFKSIIANVSSDSKITISRQPVDKPIIKLKNSKQVRLKISDGFLGPHFKMPNRIADLEFLMINGAYAASSELDWIFNRAHEKNKKSRLSCSWFRY